jgi:L-aspartate oxidase
MNSYDVIIIGTGISGVFTAINLGSEKNILIITKNSIDQSDSYLAQGGISVQLDDGDYDDFMEDTLRAGHYENNKSAVDIMIRFSREIIQDLINLGVDFDRKDSGFSYTKEGAHSKARILHFKDFTGEEINSKLIQKVKQMKNVTILEENAVIDILAKNNTCYGVVARNKNNITTNYYSQVTVFATGGIGGLFERSTNYTHLTGDAIAIALKNDVKVQDISYIQVHPTSLYTPHSGRAFLISESVRGEGAVLIDKNGNRFTDELQPRDIVTKKIYEQMKEDNMPYVRLCLYGYIKTNIAKRFPKIYEQCLKEGYDITKECVPVVPAQHYFMGGIKVDLQSNTSMKNLYAVGETSCNGVHGKNRLASNSLLESLVFSKRAAQDITYHWHVNKLPVFSVPSYPSNEALMPKNKEMILKEIEKEEKYAK